MTKSLNAADFAFELTLKPAAVRETSQMVRKRRLLANVEIGFELEQRSGPGHQQIQIRGIGDVTKRADFAGTPQIFGPASAGSLHDDRDELRHRVGPYSLGQLVAIH